jgi:hypothetical protein
LPSEKGRKVRLKSIEGKSAGVRTIGGFAEISTQAEASEAQKKPIKLEIELN